MLCGTASKRDKEGERERESARDIASYRCIIVGRRHFFHGSSFSFLRRARAFLGGVARPPISPLPRVKAVREVAKPGTKFHVGSSSDDLVSCLPWIFDPFLTVNFLGLCNVRFFFPAQNSMNYFLSFYLQKDEQFGGSLVDFMVLRPQGQWVLLWGKFVFSTHLLFYGVNFTVDTILNLKLCIDYFNSFATMIFLPYYQNWCRYINFSSLKYDIFLSGWWGLHSRQV